MRLGLITDSDLALVLAEQRNIPFIDLRNFLPDPKILALVPGKVAAHYQFLVIKKEENELHIAIADPFSKMAAEQVYRISW